MMRLRDLGKDDASKKMLQDVENIINRKIYTRDDVNRMLKLQRDALERRIAKLEARKITIPRMPEWIGVRHPLWAGTAGEPLTSTAWDGDSYSTGTGTINMNTVFGAPIGVSAVQFRVTIRDSGSAANDCVINIRPVGTSAAGLSWRCSGLADDAYTNGFLDVPCNDGNVAYSITASGADTMDVTLQIWKYEI